MLRKAMMGVLQAGGTAAASAIKGIAVAGKTGTAQTMRFSKDEQQAALLGVVRGHGAGRECQRSSSS